jgi:START domain
MKVFITVLFLFSFFFSNLLNAEQSPWELRGSRKGIPVYTRKVEGSPILEYKATVIVDAPILKVITFFEDEKKIHLWYYQSVRSELVENDGPNKEIIYLTLHLPWPVAPRDFIFSRTKSEDPTNGIISYSLKALPGRLPLVKGMIRVNSIESVWRFKSLPHGRTEIYFQQHTDPAGSVPAAIINHLAVQTPYNSLKNLRKLITGKDA